MKKFNLILFIAALGIAMLAVPLAASASTNLLGNYEGSWAGSSNQVHSGAMNLILTHKGDVISAIMTMENTSIGTVTGRGEGVAADGKFRCKIKADEITFDLKGVYYPGKFSYGDNITGTFSYQFNNGYFTLKRQ